VLDVLAMRLHRGEHIGQILQGNGKILLNEQVDRVTAGGNDDVLVILAQHALIFGLDDGCADGGFLDVVKAELLQRLAHRGNADAFVIGDEGRSEADNNRIAALQENPYLFGIVHDLFGILRAGDEAMTTEDAFILDDVRLIAGKTDRFDRTMANAFIAVLAIGFLECEKLCHCLLRPFFFQFFKDFIMKEIVESFACDAWIDVVVNLDCDANPVAVAGTEASGQGNVAFKMMLSYGVLQQSDNILGTFQMAGRTDADLNDHVSSPSQESLC